MRPQMTSLPESPTDPAVVAPLVDEALVQLSSADRDALVLRFLKQQPMEEVSRNLGVSEEAAKKRVGRALQKLRRVFSRRGVTLPVAVLALGLTAIPASAAPPALATSVTAGALAAANGVAITGAAVSLAQGAMKAMLWLKLKVVGAIATAALAVTAGGAVAIHAAATVEGAGAMPATSPVVAQTASAGSSDPLWYADDYMHMLSVLGIKEVRGGAEPSDPTAFDEANANPYPNMPEPLRMKDGTQVTTASQWPARRAEILEDFEREIYGRIPASVPAVNWVVTGTTRGNVASIPTVTRTLVGRVDNSAYPSVSVNIQASFTVPVSSTGPVPLMLEIGAMAAPRGGATPWSQQMIARGWGYATINPNSIQPDRVELTTGIIGLTRRGLPRKPDDWGVLRAWQWGISRFVDYLEVDPESNVDATRVGVAGLTIFGKAAIVAEAFDKRIAVGLIGSSGEGGVKLHRRVFGERVENIAGRDHHQWMAGNFIKYAAADPLMTPADLPVDSHELIALCAPRPVFLSHGTVANGEANWVDPHGSFMAAVLAGPVYKLLGKQDLGVSGDYLTASMPPVNTLIGGELAWRQHGGGVSLNPSWPVFLSWAEPLIGSKSEASATAVR